MKLMKIRRICLLSFSFLLLLGCNKGCSYSNEIDSESKTVSVDDVDFNIQASLTEHGNTRRSNHDYSVAVGILIGTNNFKEIITFPDEDYEVDLYAKIDPVDIRGSKDKFTYQFLYHGHICATYHLLDGILVSSPYGNNYNPLSDEEELSIGNNSVIPFYQPYGILDYKAQPLKSEVDINKYPSRSVLLKDVVLNEDIANSFDPKEAKHVSRFLAEVNLSNEELTSFFSRFPDDDLAINYFTTKKILSLKDKNPKWYVSAKRHLKESYDIGFRASEIHDLIFEHLKDQDLIASIDSAYIEKELKRTLSWSNDDYLLQRLEDSSPLSPNLENTIEHLCTKGIEDFPVKWPDQPLAELNISIKYFAKTNNNEMVKLAASKLQKLPKGTDWKADSEIRDLLKGASECISMFDDDDQKLIADFYFKNIEVFSENQQEDVLELCDGIISCKVLAPVIKEHNLEYHGDDKFFYYKPKSCN